MGVLISRLRSALHHVTVALGDPTPDQPAPPDPPGPDPPGPPQLQNPTRPDAGVPVLRLALVVGLNYDRHRRALRLRGCENDARHLTGALRRRGYEVTQLHGAAATHVVDSEATRDGLLRHVDALVARAAAARARDPGRAVRVWFSFSGHGTQRFDLDYDENDFLDEAILCDDLRTITDDEMHARLVRPLREAGCELRGLLDCCHSGTGVDLGCTYDGLSDTTFERPDAVDARGEGGAPPPPPVAGPAHCVISACADSQTAADAFIDGQYRGAATYAFLCTLGADASAPSLRAFVQQMQRALDDRGAAFTQRIACAANAADVLAQPLTL